MTVATRPWASVVIPIKDERENLVPLTEQLVKVLDSREESRSAPFELLFIDDGSTDGHARVCIFVGLTRDRTTNDGARTHTKNQ